MNTLLRKTLTGAVTALRLGAMVVATASPAGAVTTTMRSTPAPRRAAMTWPSMGMPATLCSTLGKADFMRVPWPAARMMAAIVMRIR